MDLLKLSKKIAFNEIFFQYSLPSIVGFSVETDLSSEDGKSKTVEYVKDFYQWLGDINYDDLRYNYNHGPNNLLRENSLNDILDFFHYELMENYNEKLNEYKKDKEKQALANALEKVKTKQEEEKIEKLKEKIKRLKDTSSTTKEEDQSDSSDDNPLVIKINFTGNENS